MKKVIAFLMYLMAMIIVAMPLHSQDYKTEQRSRAIHVIYDDTDTMVFDDVKNEYVDRWGQAKYAMEVFAAMLEEKDTMRVYYMSDFNVNQGGRLDAPAQITISGAEPAAERVAKIHNKPIAWAGHTPYDTVDKAYKDLRNDRSDERWLVVLTDGLFNWYEGKHRDEENPETRINVDEFFSQYVNESDVKIIFLAIDVPAPITARPGSGIYVRYAKNSSEILDRITSICNLIFNRNKLDFTNETRHEVTFDIPMKELLVFAQGTDVRINGIRGDGTYDPSEQPVNVKYSEEAAINRKGEPIKISRDLTGAVATFRNIPKGTYTMDVIGARTVEVYYKPVVNLDIRLYQQGLLETRTQDITDGKYRIQYGIVNEDGKFFESKLLGTVTYKVTAVIDGQVTPINSGDTITLKQGELKVNVKARFLDINTAESDITRNVNYIPLLQKILNWLIAYWPLPVFLLVVLLWWILWGRKKRFPKYMAHKPVIKVERDGNATTKYGSFKIKPKTKWLPLCAETGTIVAAADGIPLPQLRVKAVGNERMELTNTGDFTANRLSGISFLINGKSLSEGTIRNHNMSCTAQLKSVYYKGGVTTTQTCSFAKKGKKRR